jgi:hypothetical protein
VLLEAKILEGAPPLPVSSAAEFSIARESGVKRVSHSKSGCWNQGLVAWIHHGFIEHLVMGNLPNLIKNLQILVILLAVRVLRNYIPVLR